MVEYTGHDVYRMMRAEAAGTGSMDDAIGAVRGLSQALDNSAFHVSALEIELADGWKGGAADAAWEAANPIRRSFDDMSDHIDRHDTGMRNQSEQFKGNANSLHDIPPKPPEKGFFDHASFFWDTDNEDSINDYNQKDQHNKDKYREYMGATTNNTGDLPNLYNNAAAVNSNITIASAASSGGISAPEAAPYSGGSAGGGGSVPGGGSGSVSGGGVGGGPVGVPGSGPGSIPGQRPGQVPQPTGGASGHREPAGSSTSAQNWSPPRPGSELPNGRLSSGPGAAGGFPSGGYGSTSSYGPTGSGFGPAGGFGPGAGAGGSGAATGMGARGGMPAGGPGQSGGAPGGAGGRLGAGPVGEPAPGQAGARGAGGAPMGGRGGMGMAGAPMGGGGARGEADTEHKAADYLVNEQNAGDIVGDIPPTAPPVIGE